MPIVVACPERMSFCLLADAFGLHLFFFGYCEYDIIVQGIKFDPPPHFHYFMYLFRSEIVGSCCNSAFNFGGTTELFSLTSKTLCSLASNAQSFLPLHSYRHFLKKLYKLTLFY